MRKLLIFIILPIFGHCMLISSPFDNFRIECPQNSGTQRLSIKMVESQGMKRQDTVFALSCNKIDEIYPWSSIPQGVLELEREDCHYTSMFDPIMDTNVSYTCGPREYLAGITRVTDTRIQTMCCRLRTRDEANCENVRFGKPLGYNGKVEIQLNGKLINALNVEKNLYKVRFCDLVPCAIEAILNDIKTTTTARAISTTTTKTMEQTTTFKPSTTIVSNKLVTEQIKETTKLSNGTSSKKTAENESETVVENGNDLRESGTDEESKDQLQEVDVMAEANNQELELFQTSTTFVVAANEDSTPASVEAERISLMSTAAVPSVEISAEEKILSPSNEPTKIIPQNISTSFEVQASPKPEENIFPNEKDYENIEEAEAELMSTIAEMIKARKIAKNIISKVKAAGVKQQIKEKQEKMAEELLREIEVETDPEKADVLFKQSVEMLNELSEAKQIMSTEEFSKEMMKQEEMKKEDDFEPTTFTPTLPDSFEKDVFDIDNTPKYKLTTFPLMHILTSTNAPRLIIAPKSTTTTTIVRNNKLKQQQSQFKPIVAVEMPIDATSFEEDIFEKSDETTKTPSTRSLSTETIITTHSASSETTPKSLTRAKPPITFSPISKNILHNHHRAISSTSFAPYIDNSQSIEDAFDYPKLLFVKKHIKNPIVLKPYVEEGPSEEVLTAASSSKEARRAPAKYFEEVSATLPPLDNFPSPPSRTRSRPKPLELPRVSPPREEYRPPIIEFDEYDELFRQTTPIPYFYKSYRKHNPNPHLAAPNARGNFVDQPYVDELTKNSPFETSYENRFIPSVRPRYRLTKPTTSPPEPTTTTEDFATEATTEFAFVYEEQPPLKSRSNDNSPFDFPEIRRAPIPRRKAYEEYKNYDEIIPPSQSFAEKIALDAILAAKSTESPQPIAKEEYSQVDLKDGEGVMSFEPANNKEMEIQKAKDLLIEDISKTQVDATEYQNEQDNDVDENHQEIETLVPMNAMDQSVSVETNSTEEVIEVPEVPEQPPTTKAEATPTTEASTTQSKTTSPPETTTLESQNTGEYYVPEYQDVVEEPEPPTYDPRAFYHTLPPRPITKKGKYLTFCTKDLAIRDSNNMVVACGSESEVWEPKRCPDGTDCFYTTDSAYRICCPVANG